MEAVLNMEDRRQALDRDRLLAFAAQVSFSHEQDLGRVDTCEAVSAHLDEETDGELSYMQGTRTVDGRRTPHAWCVTADGAIVDATANQFGYERVQYIPLWDHRQQEFRHALSFERHEVVESEANSFFCPVRLAGRDSNGAPTCYVRIPL